MRRHRREREKNYQLTLISADTNWKKKLKRRRRMKGNLSAENKMFYGVYAMGKRKRERWNMEWGDHI